MPRGFGAPPVVGLPAAARVAPPGAVVSRCWAEELATAAADTAAENKIRLIRNLKKCKKRHSKTVLYYIELHYCTVKKITFIQSHDICSRFIKS
jgi:hypothetical protein